MRLAKLQFQTVTRPISDVEPDGGRSWEAWGDESSELGPTTRIIWIGPVIGLMVNIVLFLLAIELNFLLLFTVLVKKNI